MVGAAIALADHEVASSLDGQVVFFVVPAEEYGEIEFKNQLKNEGKIRYGGGKCELIRIGAFDDIDLNLAHHTTIGNEVVIRKGGAAAAKRLVDDYKPIFTKQEYIDFIHFSAENLVRHSRAGMNAA